MKTSDKGSAPIKQMRLRALLALATVLIVAGCDPKVHIRDLDGRNAKSNAFRIVVDKDAPFRAAIVAQELYEAEEKQNPIRAVKIRLDNNEQRKLEIEGHEVETQAAVLIYEQNETAYRLKEATSMQRGYNGLFKRRAVTEIAGAMEQYSVAAKQWVNVHHKKLKLFKN